MTMHVRQTRSATPVPAHEAPPLDGSSLIPYKNSLFRCVGNFVLTVLILHRFSADELSILHKN